MTPSSTSGHQLPTRSLEDSHPSIIWLAARPTPQFAPVLNRLFNDYHLSIVAYYMERGSGNRGWGDLQVRHPHVYRSPHGWVRDVFAGYALSKTSSLRTAVVFGYSYGLAMGLLLGCRLRGIQVFTQSDSDYLQHLRKPLYLRVLKAIVLRILYSPRTQVWSISRGNSQYWRAHGLNHQRHVPFESPIPESNPAPNQIRPPHPPSVLYVGRLSPEKGLTDAVIAVSYLRRQGIGASLRLVGDGALPTEAGQFADDADWLQQIGAVAHDQLALEYLRADVLVLPSEEEAYGLVVREALQFGLPVVATNVVPSARELCDKGWNLVPPRDPRALARALKFAVERGERWSPIPPANTTEFYFEELKNYGSVQTVNT